MSTSRCLEDSNGTAASLGSSSLDPALSSPTAPLKCPDFVCIYVLREGITLKSPRLCESQVVEQSTGHLPLSCAFSSCQRHCIPSLQWLMRGHLTSVNPSFPKQACFHGSSNQSTIKAPEIAAPTATAEDKPSALYFDRSATDTWQHLATPLLGLS